MSKIETKLQISAGGVAFRERGGKVEVAIISVGENPRWQLPKGIVDEGETTAAAALREVREEAGVETSMVALIDKVEYWYYPKDRGRRVRFHKFVYFYLLKYVSGYVRDHDSEVNEARWVEIDEAIGMLAFESEKSVVSRARDMIVEL
jgi:8-oxo-dGTP pyrophosphatase MutT (NUDIX family)